MARIVLSALTQAEAAGRPQLHTGVATLGLGSDEFVCCHCGRIIMRNYDITKSAPDQVFICGQCGGYNQAPLKQ